MRLLVIEDERELADALKRGLSAEGFAVDLAFDGREGLWMAGTGEYAGIILDLMLPGLNGYKVCQALRREQIETPILVLTAKDGDYDQAEALDTGADDYLTKPFSYLVLLARVRALLRRGRGTGSPLLAGVQGAARMRGMTGAQILAHPAEHAWLAAGRVPREGRSGTAGRLLDRLPKLHWQLFTPDGAVADHQLIDGAGLRAIHTPGHSPGHLAFLYEPTGTVLVGDAVFHRGTLALGPSALAADPDLRPESLHALPRTINAIGFAHGPRSPARTRSSSFSRGSTPSRTHTSIQGVEATNACRSAWPAATRRPSRPRRTPCRGCRRPRRPSAGSRPAGGGTRRRDTTAARNHGPHDDHVAAQVTCGRRTRAGPE